MAGEIPGLAEPAIVLTPNDEDVPFEGLRTASDVAVMRLDADLVMLSACNTAVPESGPDAEGLSGLARAFLQAGARRLLVSPGGQQSGSGSADDGLRRGVDERSRCATRLSSLGSGAEPYSSAPRR